MAEERVLITFQGRDTGLARTAKSASDAFRLMSNSLDRVRSRAPNLSYYQNIFETTRRTYESNRQILENMRQQLRAAANTTAAQRQQYANQQEVVRLLSKTLSIQRNALDTRREEIIAANTLLNVSKQLAQAEARYAAAKDLNVARSKAAAAIAEEEQRRLVEATKNKFFEGPPGALSSFANFLSGGTGGVDNLISVLGAKFSTLATAAGVASVAMGGFQLAVSATARVVNAAIVSVTALVNAMRMYAQGLASIVTTQARAVTNVVRFAQGLWEQWRASRQANQQMREADGVVRAYGNNLRGLVGTVNNLNRGINVFGASIRQIGQAMQNAGVLMTIYLSLPFGQVLKSWVDGAMEYNNALIEIRKNSGLTTAAIEKWLSPALENLAMMTPTGIQDLAEMMGDAARGGIPIQYLLDFTKTIDQLVVATNIGADDAVTSMARLLNIFYGTGEAALELQKDFGAVIRGMGSAINELGQNNAVTETEIVAAIYRLAPAAKAMRLSFAEAAALAATVAAVSASPERAGTQAATLLTYLGANLQQLSEVTGESVEDLAAAINADPIDALNRLAEALSRVEDSTARIAAIKDVFGLVGGKAVNALAESQTLFGKNLELSNEAFEQGTSLAIEFGRAMDSVKNQVKLAGNNLQILGNTIAKAVLPEITKVLAYAIPVIQAITAWYESLGEEIKVATIAFIALMAVLGPLFYALGSILFQIGIFTTGMTGLTAMIMRSVTAPITFAMSLLSMLTPMRLIAALAIAVAIAFFQMGTSLGSVSSIVGGALNNMLTGFGKFFSGVINRTKTFIDTMVNGLTGVARSMAHFLQNFTKKVADPVGEGFAKLVGDGAMPGAQREGERVGLGMAMSMATALQGNQNLRGVASTVGENVGNSIGLGARIAAEQAGPESARGFMERFGEEAEAQAQETGEAVGEAIGQGVTDAIENSVSNAVSGMTAVIIRGTLDMVSSFAANFGDQFRGVVGGMGTEVLETLSEVFSMVPSIFEAFAAYFNLDDQAINEAIQTIGQTLIDAFGPMGDSLESVQGLFEGLRPFIGSFVDDFEELIDRTVAYNREQQKLIDLKEQLEGFDRETDAQILAIARRTDLTAMERASAIRQIKLRRAEEKQALEDQIDDQEDVTNAAREQLEVQKQIISILQSMIPRRETEDPDFDAESPIVDLADSIEDAKNPFETLSELLDNASASFFTFFDAMKESRDFMLGFLSGILGEDLVDASYNLDFESFFAGWKYGGGIRKYIFPWFEALIKLLEATDEALVSIGDGFLVFSEGVESGFNFGAQGNGVNSLGAQWQPLFDFGVLIGEAAKFIDDMFFLLRRTIFGNSDPLESTLIQLGNFFAAVYNGMGGWSGVRQTFTSIGQTIERIVVGVGTIISQIINALPGLGTTVGNILSDMLGFADRFLEVLAGILDIIQYFGTNGPDWLLSGGITSIFGSNSSAGGIFQELLQGDSLALGTGQSIFATTDWATIGTHLGDMIGGMISLAISHVDTTMLSEMAAALVNVLLGIFGAISPDALAGVFAIVPNALIDALGRVNSDAVEEAVRNILNAFFKLGEIINFESAVEIFADLAQSIVDGIASADWASFVDSFFVIAKGIVAGLAGFDWSSLIDMFTVIATAIINNLNDPDLWENAGIALTNMVNAVVDAIDAVDWTPMESIAGLIRDSLIQALLGIEWSQAFDAIIEPVTNAITEAVRIGVMGFLSLILKNPFPILFGIEGEHIFGGGFTGLGAGNQASAPITSSVIDFFKWLATPATMSNGNMTWPWPGQGQQQGAQQNSQSGPGFWEGLWDSATGLWPWSGDQGSSGGGAEFAAGATSSLGQAVESTITTVTPLIEGASSTMADSAFTAYSDGIESNFTRDMAHYDSIMDSYDKWFATNENLIDLTGRLFSSTMSGGVLSYFTENDAHFAELLNSASLWLNGNESAIKSVGSRFAAQIIAGFNATRPLFIMMFNVLLDAFRQWLSIDGGGSSFLDAWVVLGQSASEAFNSGLAGNYTAAMTTNWLTSVIDSLGEGATVSTASTPTPDPTNRSGFAPAVATEGAGASVNLTININGYNGDPKRLADEVWKEVERRIKYTR